jgi:hypothetical protein
MASCFDLGAREDAGKNTRSAVGGRIPELERGSFDVCLGVSGPVEFMNGRGMSHLREL